MGGIDTRAVKADLHRCQNVGRIPAFDSPSEATIMTLTGPAQVVELSVAERSSERGEPPSATRGVTCVTRVTKCLSGWFLR